MAAQDEKRWYQKPLQVTIIGVIMAAVIAFVVQQATKEDPPPGASSEGATLILDDYPHPSTGGKHYQFSGGGWHADNSVYIRYPLVGDSYGGERIAVQNGRFDDAQYSVGVLQSGRTYEVTATGEQSGYTVTETFDT
jgi:hypothetical protein